MKYYVFAVSQEGSVHDLSDPLNDIEEASNKAVELFKEYGEYSMYFRASVTLDGQLDIDDQVRGSFEMQPLPGDKGRTVSVLFRFRGHGRSFCISTKQSHQFLCYRPDFSPRVYI
jgi:hypothetical protein